MQLTDLHLTYGFDNYDQKTFTMIERMAEKEKPDIIIFTGDQTMSPSAKRLYKQLADFMKKINIPWTFNFGNHDNDFNSYKVNLDQVVDKYDSLLFKVGPNLEKGGFGNFIIDIKYEDDIFYRLYMMDSKNEYGGLMIYDFFSPEQVQWFTNHINEDQSNHYYSSSFFHIPLVQYKLYTDYAARPDSDFEGQRGEDNIYSQSEDTGMYAAMVAGGMTQGVFVGHDHLNNFSFITDDGILLAYGQTSGYNGYGIIERGCRIIEIDASKNLSTRKVYASEVDL